MTHLDGETRRRSTQRRLYNIKPNQPKQVFRANIAKLPKMNIKYSIYTMHVCDATIPSSPTLTFRITSAAAIPGYGVDPSVTISHIRMPKLQMSDFTEKMSSYNDSIAIHLLIRFDMKNWGLGNHELYVNVFICVGFVFIVMCVLNCRYHMWDIDRYETITQ